MKLLFLLSVVLFVDIGFFFYKKTNPFGFVLGLPLACLRRPVGVGHGLVNNCQAQAPTQKPKTKAKGPWADTKML